MKHLSFLFTLLLLGAGSHLYAQKKLTGTWQANVGSDARPLRLIFHFTEANGTITGTMDSPDQGSTGLPIKEIKRNKDSILVDMSDIHIQYTGLLASNDSIAGQWHQAGRSMAIPFKKMDDAAPSSKVSDAPVKHLTSDDLTAQKKLIGHWQGNINLGKRLPLTFHFVEENGKIKGTVDSPDQGAMGLQVKEVIVDKDSLLIDMSNLGIQYTGVLISADSIDGEWHQAGSTYSVPLKRTATPLELKRPQTPKPPFNYQSEDVTFTNKDHSITYAGTITIPNGKGPFPAAVLITGSGPENRDEEVFGHKPFAVIADQLTKHGYVVLRVDDRGTGKTTGIYHGATTADFAKDVNAHLDYLKSRKEVNDKKMGLIGHSEGGIIAPIVASERKDVDFIVMLAGVGIPTTKGMELQNVAVMKKKGLTEVLADQYGFLYYGAVMAINASKDSATARQKITEAVKQWQLKAEPGILDGLDMRGPEAVTESTDLFLQMYNDPWFHYFLSINPTVYLEKLSCKVLALNGEKDIQVVSQPNLDGIRASLAKSKTKNYEVRELAGLNHLFQTCNTCSVEEYRVIEETFAPIALQTMTEWLDKNVK
ncbi:alpha/beta hydrolase family protein [Taibaiella soli]|uniref:Alpha/beta hydrolase n=1 Tax=Taibaiella soli TaxID=1649169 RepID=A0A2W2B1S6_9BACT|nr:alpha/beta fold hydrolase [Taibaiella soli]PZF73968.1 alpha/beta hydrolase [Taibaiella soli]